MPATTVTQILQNQNTDPELITVIDVITQCCQEIAEQLRLGALTGILGATVDTNVQGETQKELDVIANNILKDKLLQLPLIAGIASEEEDLPVAGNEGGRFLVLFDPLDGSSNIDVNVSVGTIFSILELLAGKEGTREKNFNMRWIASMVADVHRVLTRGGIFTYPWDNRDSDKPGKLRLMYEGNPMSFLVEQAGGLATTCFGNILDIQPQQIHQRVSVALGSKHEIEVLLKAHKNAADSQAARLNQ
jgi:fructose-1,6-bisphosphatase